MHIPAHSSRRGSTLVIAILVVAILSVFIGLALNYTQQTALNARRGRDLTIAQSLADGALEALYAKWQYVMAVNQNSALGTTDGEFATHTWLQTNIANPVLASLRAANTNGDFALTELDISPVDQADTPQDVQKTEYKSTGPLPDTPGWIAKSLNYRARAVVVRTGLAANAAANADRSGKTVVSVSRYFQQADASLFQAMLFFNDDLELHPGAEMTLYGLVHTNKNMYTAGGAGVSLTFTSNVSYTGNPPPNPASAKPKNFYQSADNGYVEWVTQTLYDQESQWKNGFANPIYATDRSSQLSPVKALDPLGLGKIQYDASNPNDTGTHEIIERPVPGATKNNDIPASTASADPVASHRLFNSASLRVLINRNAQKNGGMPVRVYKPGSKEADSKYITPLLTSSDPEQVVAAQIIAAISPEGSTPSITDAREGRGINLNDVDVSKLVTPLNNYPGYNGVVYISDITNADTAGETGNSDAIKLIRGATLPLGQGKQGFTVVSDGAVYVQGDYNTGGEYVTTLATDTIPSTQPNSNSLTNPQPTQYTVAGKSYVPAAVIGDAVMILSNAWLDAGSKTVNLALPTTFNAALVSGQVITSTETGKSSGGAHNFPRFLENWTSKNFTYHGSMVELYQSKHFTGTYTSAGSVYNAPKRRWYFDDNFVLQPPPGNLRATDYVRGRWVRNSLSGYEPIP